MYTEYISVFLLLFVFFHEKKDMRIRRRTFKPPTVWNLMETNWEILAQIAQILTVFWTGS